MHKRLAFAVGLLIATAVAADGAEIKIISAKAAGLFLGELAAQFERATGNKVNISYDEAGIVRRRILGGEEFDVTFLPAGWEEVRKALANNPVAIGHSDLGMAVLSTAPKPDTSTNEATKQTLLAVKSIVYTDPKTGGIAGVLFARMIERLGIADRSTGKASSWRASSTQRLWQRARPSLRSSYQVRFMKCRVFSSSRCRPSSERVLHFRAQSQPLPRSP